jgi:hypothetical protein
MNTVEQQEDNISNVKELILELLDYYKAIPKRPFYNKDKEDIKKLLAVLRFGKNLKLKNILGIISRNIKLAKDAGPGQCVLKMAVWSDIYHIFKQYLQKVKK